MILIYNYRRDCLDHYFISKQHKEDDYFQFDWNFFDENFTFKSCDDVFSKNNVDYGTYVLLKTILNCVDVNGEVLDIGCGYGPIGIVIDKFFKDVKITMIDINQTAVELTKQNIIKNRCKNMRCVKVSNAYENVDGKFDFIISNPPIKAGKTVLLEILIGAFDRLNSDGKLIFVIKKKFGEDSVKKQLEKLFSLVEVLKRDSGYYVLMATK